MCRLKKKQAAVEKKDWALPSCGHHRHFKLQCTPPSLTGQGGGSLEGALAAGVCHGGGHSSSDGRGLAALGLCAGLL